MHGGLQLHLLIRRVEGGREELEVNGSRVNLHFVFHRSRQCRTNATVGPFQNEHFVLIRAAVSKLDRMETIEERPIAP